MSEFFAMGGYATFVWSSYAVGVLTIAFNLISARRRMRITLERLALRAARQRIRQGEAERS